MIFALAGLAALGAALKLSRRSESFGFGSVRDAFPYGTRVRVRRAPTQTGYQESDDFRLLRPGEVGTVISNSHGHLLVNRNLPTRATGIFWDPESELERIEPGVSGLSGGGARYVRGGWDAARRRQQQLATKKFKPGPFDHWTDEELWEKARGLIVGPDGASGGAYDEGAWYDLDRAYTIANWARRDAKTCYAIDQHIRRAVPAISLAKRIYDTGRLTRFATGTSPIDFNLLAQRVKEAINAHNAACPTPYNGPTFP